jgi:hypothetical protein
MVAIKQNYVLSEPVYLKMLSHFINEYMRDICGTDIRGDCVVLRRRGKGVVHQ